MMVRAVEYFCGAQGCGVGGGAVSRVKPRFPMESSQ